MKAAVIGCGKMGGQPSSRLDKAIPKGWLPISHIESLRSTRKIQGLFLCDSNTDLLKERGSYYGITGLYSDYRALITEVQPDIITIATRTSPKCEIINFACRNGVKGIYVEKPISTSIKECRLAMAEISKNNVSLVYGVNRRYHSVYRHAKRLIRRGVIGDVVDIVVEHGESQLLWSHPHSVDMILFFADQHDVDRIQASLATKTVNQTSDLVVDSDPVIENAFFKVGGNQVGHIVKSTGFNVRIGGTQGNLTVHADGSWIQLDRKNTRGSGYLLKEKRITQIPNKGATVTAMDELIKSVRTRMPIDSSHIEQGMNMLIGCVWSHLNQGRTIKIEDIPPNLIVTGKYGDIYA